MSPKKWLVTGALAVVVLAAPLYTGAGQPAPALAADSAVQEHFISVTGTGEMTIQPDVAYVNLGIQTKAETASAAQSANAEAFAKLENMLYNESKLDSKDVKTTGFNVYPDYSYTEKEQKIIGYTATQTVQVTYREISKLGSFLDAASLAGVNLVNGIQFSTEKGKDYELQVIEKAMANAEEKAKVIAKYAGKDLKGILNVTQTNSTGVPIQYANYSVAAKSAAMDMAMPSTSISAGDMKVVTNVTVQFSF